MRERLTAESARELLHYDPETGEFLWKDRAVCWFRDTEARSAEIHCAAWNTRYAGTKAFISKQGPKDGYQCLQGRILNKHYKAHRIAWLISFGEWPELEVDHINRNPLDNRLKNLRQVSHIANMANKRISKNNKSGFQGVSFRPIHRKWCAKYTDHGRRINVGYFDSPQEAAQALAASRRQLLERFFG